MFEKIRYPLYFIIASIVVMLIWINTFSIANYLITRYYNDNNNQGPTLAELGDMFGISNSIFSGLALSGIIITILLQRSELKEQRKELVNTREEFQINRITNNIYKQITRIDNSISNILIPVSTNEKILGLAGIYEVNQSRNHLRPVLNENNFDELISELKLLTSDLDSFNELGAIMTQSYLVVSKLLRSHELKPIYKSELANIYFLNISIELKNYFRNIYEMIEYGLYRNENLKKELTTDELDKIKDVHMKSKNIITIINRIVDNFISPK